MPIVDFFFLAAVFVLALLLRSLTGRSPRRVFDGHGKGWRK